MIGWWRPGTATINLWVLSIVVPLAMVFGETAHAGLTVDIIKVMPASFLYRLHDDVRQFDGTLASRILQRPT
jgi:hypothetical protein